MKQFMCVIMFFIALVLTPCDANAKSSKLSEKEKAKIEKEALKEAKQVAKINEKEGWKIEQSGLMANIIARHIAKKNIEGLQELNGTSVDRRTRSGCRKQIQVDVPIAYAKSQSQVVQGKIVGKDRFRDGDEAEDFIGEYETRLAKEIAGDLVESYSMYRKNPDGTYDMVIYYLVDPESAYAAKIRAAEAAMELHELDAKWRNEISNAIRED